MLTCEKCNCRLQDPFGRVKEVCDQCGWNSSAEKEVLVESGPRSTADQIEITERSTDFSCPICHDQNLHVATLIRTQVCCCPGCHGFLIDSETLGDLIQLLRAGYTGPDDRPELVDQRALQKKMNCPTCLEKMFTHVYYGTGNAVINSCNRCHLNWFDAGELTSIIRAPGIR